MVFEKSTRVGTQVHGFFLPLLEKKHLGHEVALFNPIVFKADFVSRMSSLKSKIKKGIKRTFRAWFAPKIGSSDFRRALDVLKVPKEKPVLVHSSLSAFGFVPGGPQTLLESLQTYLQPDTTIVFPTHSWGLVSRGLRTFDARSTPSCVGAVTEWFRQQPNVIRSLHPTHSVAALGPMAAAITSRHEDSVTPCGLESPYERLLAMDATILFLGAPLTTNTSYHCCEGIVGVPYLLRDHLVDFELVDQEGGRIQKSMALHQAGVPRNLEPLNSMLKDQGVLNSVPLGHSAIQSIRGLAFRKILCDQLIANANFLIQ